MACEFCFPKIKMLVTLLQLLSYFAVESDSKIHSWLERLRRTYCCRSWLSDAEFVKYRFLLAFLAVVAAGRSAHLAALTCTG